MVRNTYGADLGMVSPNEFFDGHNHFPTSMVWCTCQMK